jgi:hypothetical protein
MESGEDVGRRKLPRLADLVPCRVIGGSALRSGRRRGAAFRRPACCGVAEGPRLAVALSRGRVLLVAEQG